MGAGVMLLYGNKTLILKRAKYKEDKWSGYWNFPGGQGEPNESTYETALRETYEETNIDSSQYQIVNHVDTRIYTMYIGICDSDITPTLDHEHTEWLWVDLKTIPKIKDKMHPKDWKGFTRFFRDYQTWK